MTDTAEQLSPQQKELVAVGASVGAGCHPCVKHHIGAATKTGLGEERLIAALTSSDRIAAEAAKRMATHSRAVLGVEPEARAAPTSSFDDALASLGAAIAANDKVAIEAQIAVARAAGVSQAQLEGAVQTAATVQKNAGRIHIREAERLVSQPAAGTEDKAGEPGCGEGCPCNDETASMAER